MIAFTVYGKPEPAGSKRAFVKGGRAVVVDDNPKGRPWMNAISSEAARAMMEQADPERPGDPAPELFSGALSLDLRFYMRRPQSHFGTGRNAGRLKDTAPRFHTTRPDSTKLTRAVEDALTGVVWRDDAQVSTQVIAKLYGEPERVVVAIYPLNGEGSELDL
jgi:Holliday junction resolvase RusA-like endonuclease